MLKKNAPCFQNIFWSNVNFPCRCDFGLTDATEFLPQITKMLSSLGLWDFVAFLLSDSTGQVELQCSRTG
jgi:hypothetical protein